MPERADDAAEVGDLGAVIGDLGEFLKDTDSVAVMMRDGQMFVLKSETLTWVSIDEVRAQQAKKKRVSERTGKISALPRSDPS